MFEEVTLVLSDIESNNIEEMEKKMKSNSSVILPNYLTAKNNMLYVINDSETKKNVGVIYLYDINSINQNACIDGFVIEDKYISKLIISYLLLMYKGMIELNLHKIYAKHLVGDAYYKRIYDFLRFTLEGDFRDDVNRAGKFYDVQVRSILKHEFIRYYLTGGNNLQKVFRLEGF